MGSVGTEEQPKEEEKEASGRKSRFFFICGPRREEREDERRATQKKVGDGWSGEQKQEKERKAAFSGGPFYQKWPKSNLERTAMERGEGGITLCG